MQHGTLFRVLCLIAMRRFYGAYEVPIGNTYLNKKAEVYERHREGDPYWGAEHNSVSDYLSRLDSIKTVLDAPFGTGRFMPLYLQHNLEIIALDISKDMIEEAKKLIGQT